MASTTSVKSFLYKHDAYASSKVLHYAIDYIDSAIDTLKTVDPFDTNARKTVMSLEDKESYLWDCFVAGINVFGNEEVKNSCYYNSGYCDSTAIAEYAIKGMEKQGALFFKLYRSQHVEMLQDLANDLVCASSELREWFGIK